jgi:hypothetical protein
MTKQRLVTELGIDIIFDEQKKSFSTSAIAKRVPARRGGWAPLPRRSLRG